jgi:excisionase family DNA binding protein
MSGSPAATLTIAEATDIFDQLSQCERLLTAKELAGMLAISPKTIYSYVERNMIPYYRIEANVRFRASDIARWLRGHAGPQFDISVTGGVGLARAGRTAWR